jgi:hypothetical protein
MSEADLEELSQQVRDLATRVSRLEGLLTTRDVPRLAPEPAAPARSDDADTLSGVPDTTAFLPVLGTGLLGLAGAYLLRAIAESGVLPARGMFTLGTLYAAGWLIGAARTSSERRLATTVYTLTAVSILSPLLWESTLRFHLVTASETSLILVAFTLIGLAVSWRRDLLIVATISTLAGLGTAAALLVATHDVLPFIFVFLATAAAVEACACLNHWLGVRWLAAIVANLSIVLATWLVTNPLGLPDVYAPIPAGALFAAQMALLAIYLASVMVRTFLRGLTITTFETGQCALAFLIGLGGAMRLSAGDTHIIPAIGAFALLCGAACYALSFIVLERHGTHGRNFYTYSTFGVLLVLMGGRILFSGGAEAILWSVLAVACIGAGGLWGRMTLEVHGGIYLALALVLLGALHQSARFVLGTDIWPGAASAALWSGVAVAGGCYLLALRTAPVGDGGWNFHAFRVCVAALLAWVIVGLSAGILTGIYHKLFGAAVGDPYCATMRTGTLTATALLLAWAGSRVTFSHLGHLVYPLMLIGAYRLIVLDLHQNHKVALFLSLLVYGAALMAIPRLRRTPVASHQFSDISKR